MVCLHMYTHILTKWIYVIGELSGDGVSIKYWWFCNLKFTKTSND